MPCKKRTRMITFDLRDCRSLIHEIERETSPDYKKVDKLGFRLDSIAATVQGKLPHPLLEVGKFSSGGPDFQSSRSKKPNSALVKTLVAPTRFMSDAYLAFDLELTLKAGIYAGAYWEKHIDQADAAYYAKDFVNHFMTKQGEMWYDDGGLSHAIKHSPEGQNLIKQISTEFKEKMFAYGGDFTKIKLSDKISKPSFSWSSSPTLKILVGGTQKLIVNLSAIFYNPKKCNWAALISVEIRDDFGVTEGDLTKASPAAKLGIGGLTDMWVLQHQRGKKPFTSVFNFSFFCYGDY